MKKKFKKKSQQSTVVDYLIEALKAIGVEHVFGVPGDFSFPIADTICHHKRLKWIGSSNELNAAYAADGYARRRGIAALCTTYGPGELSALNGVAGAYSAHLPIIFIVGMPSTVQMKGDKMLHHTLGDGQFDRFVQMSAQVTEAQIVLSAQQAQEEIQDMIQLALTTQRPVYIGVPEDVAYEIIEQPRPFDFCTNRPSHADEINAMAKRIAKKINKAKQPILLVGEHLRAFNAKQAALELINNANLPFMTLFGDKGTLDERHPNFIGVYTGQINNLWVHQYVKSCDCLLNLGGIFSDVNMGVYSVEFPKKVINIMGDGIHWKNKSFQAMNLKDLITAISGYVRPKEAVSYPSFTGYRAEEHNPEHAISATSLYPKLAHFFRQEDQIIAETGTVSMGLTMAHLPSSVSYDTQALWASIGWATPAAFGAAIAHPHKRTILLTGEGSHQLTVQEIGQFVRYGLTPIIIVLNNNGYLIERLLCKEPDIDYNDLCQWQYTKLPEAFGANDWLVKKVTTNAELDSALEMANQANTGVYIEVVTAAMESPAFAVNIAAHLNNARGLPTHIAPIAD